ncbi:hypothetical protein GYB29_07410 [bacterium]|nr:hypothetical protein [bacterium]
MTKKKKQILSDHKKQGKKLVPPLLTIGNHNFISWVDKVLPELLWMACIIDYCDLKKGIEICISVAEAAQSAQNVEKNNWFAPVSTYSKLSKPQQKKMSKILADKEQLKSIQHALKPLAFFYPDFPLSFVFGNEQIQIKEQEVVLQEFKRMLLPLYDKTSKEATYIQANAIFLLFQAERLKVPSGSSLTQINEISNYPDTDLSRMVASSIRASINTFFGNELMHDIDSNWCEYFWNRGMELESCYTRQRENEKG